MKINWFPGHMKKALDEMRSKLSSVDVIIYVLDSRAPKSSLSPELDKISGGKPVLYVLNKVDLSEPEKLKSFTNSLKKEGVDYILLNSTKSGVNAKIVEKIKNLAKDKILKYQNKGVKITVRAMVVGVPNSGKSTLVNNLLKKAKSTTGNMPGVTKKAQWFSIDGQVEVLDTPGTLYPNLSDQEVAKTLFFIGSIKEEIVDTEELAREFILRAESLYPGRIKERYGSLSLSEIAKNRGCVLGGGQLDLERAARLILSDFRSGKLGCMVIENL